MNRAYFISGWAGQAEQFPRLSQNVRHVSPFIDAGPEQIVSMLEQGQGELLVGWSTGAHIILKAHDVLFPRYKHIVLIAPFLAFTDSIPARVVRNTIRGMREDARGTVRVFYESCGETADIAYKDAYTTPLVQGLDFLLKSRVVLEQPVSAENVTIVYGTRDRVVRTKALEKCVSSLPGARLVLHDTGHKVEEELLKELLTEYV